ncbi:hypothetical protein BDQ17DRAFT_876113 [Cyathus striatus]|nr:hypothetical protein BDQ17DRAFT_876113 [Cyathus striatus]
MNDFCRPPWVHARTIAKRTLVLGCVSVLFLFSSLCQRRRPHAQLLMTATAHSLMTSISPLILVTVYLIKPDPSFCLITIVSVLPRVPVPQVTCMALWEKVPGIGGLNHLLRANGTWGVIITISLSSRLEARDLGSAGRCLSALAAILL